MALWGGRFSQTADSRFAHFNNSLAIDHRLAKQDILGSIAWSKALKSVRVLTDEEQMKIEHLLQTLLVTIETDPNILLQSQVEDIHSWVEEELIKQLGDLGKKLHTGRSRNDQVTTDLKLWCKMQVDLTTNELNILRHNLVACADRYQDAIMPGYTHL